MKPIKAICTTCCLVAWLSACDQKTSQVDQQQLTESAASAKMKSLTQPLSFLSEQTLDSVCRHRPMDPDQGDPIDTLKAAKKLAAYKAIRDVDGTYDAKKDIYGFAFGLNTIKELTTAIDKYNAAHPANSITGIRVYMGISSTSTGPIPDAFLMPVLQSGHNLFDIDPDFGKEKLAPKEMVFDADAPPIVNTSAPCPNRCQ